MEVQEGSMSRLGVTWAVPSRTLVLAFVGVEMRPPSN
jgi:hypothetical protein